MINSKIKRAIASSSIIVTLVFTMTVTNVPVIAPVATAHAAKVYYAPYSGKKYHCRRNCRGLSRARSIKKISKSKLRGYKKCKICYR